MGTVAVDFSIHGKLGVIAREEYGLAGTVQHGASTLPDALFHRFREVETAEIHLATGFQNALYEHPAFPEELHRQIEGWCFANALDERKADQTDQQFVYTTRKKALGPFKRELWDLETKDEILASQAKKIGFLFHELGVDDSRDMVEKYVHPVESHGRCRRRSPPRFRRPRPPEARRQSRVHTRDPRVALRASPRSFRCVRSAALANGPECSPHDLFLALRGP